MSELLTLEESVIDVRVVYNPVGEGEADVADFVVFEQTNNQPVNHAGGFFALNDINGTTYMINQGTVQCLEIGVPRPRLEEDGV